MIVQQFIFMTFFALNLILSDTNFLTLTWSKLYIKIKVTDHPQIEFTLAKMNAYLAHSDLPTIDITTTARIVSM